MQVCAQVGRKGHKMNTIHQKETRGSHWSMKKTSGFLLLLLFLLLPWFLFFTEQATAGELELLVPAYGNPGDSTGTGKIMWDTLISTVQNANTNNSPLHFNIIFNPDSGPGMSTDPNYYNPMNPSVGNQLVNLRNAGGSHVTVYGYVKTSGGGRPLSEIMGDIDKYQMLYPNLVDGIFLDEMSNQLSMVAYYHDIYVYIKN
jgi:hypothetical protein